MKSKKNTLLPVSVYAAAVVLLVASWLLLPTGGKRVFDLKIKNED